MSWNAQAHVRAYIATPPPLQPTTVWSAPIRIEAGLTYPRQQLIDDLLNADLVRADDVNAPGKFNAGDGIVQVWTPRDAPGPVSTKATKSTISYQGDVIASVSPPLSLPPTRLAVLGDPDQRRDRVTMEQLSPWMAPALLSIEDARFHEHAGVDPVGVLRAAWNNLRGSELHGGSTLTQQLAKNIFLHRGRTLSRKVSEVFYAGALERELGKNGLLELYLSEVYLGHSGGLPLYGVEQAARAWFGTSATHLSVGQAAMLAGVIASPNRWSPLKDPQAATRRRDQVIERMVYVRALTEAQAEAARSESLELRAHPPRLSARAPWAVDAALRELQTRSGGDVSPAGGLDIFTTIQPPLQAAAREAVAELQHPEAEAALVSVVPSSGAVEAIVGARATSTAHSTGPSTPSGRPGAPSSPSWRSLP